MTELVTPVTPVTPVVHTIDTQIRSALNDLSAYLTDPDDRFDVGQTLANIVSLIKVHPQQADILMPEDIGTMVASLRQRYGIVIVKTESKSRKTKSKVKDSGITIDFLNELGFDKL